MHIVSQKNFQSTGDEILGSSANIIESICAGCNCNTIWVIKSGNTRCKALFLKIDNSDVSLGFFYKFPFVNVTNQCLYIYTECVGTKIWAIDSILHRSRVLLVLGHCGLHLTVRRSLGSYFVRYSNNVVHVLSHISISTNICR